MTQLNLRELGRLAKRAVKGWVGDGAPSMGAALAFYTMLSLAPLLLVAVGIAGFFVGREEAQGALISQLALLLGEKAAFGIQAMLEGAGSQEEGFLPALIGFGTMILGATTVFAELRSDLDRIWRFRAPKAQGAMKWVFSRLFSFILVVSIGALLLFSLAASTFLATLGTYWFGRSDLLLHAIEFFTSFVVVTMLFALIYKILPSKPIAWGDVWVGAAVTSLLFWAGKFLIALYISHAAVDSGFGAAGALVLVVVWVYYSAQVFFLGAEFTREYALRLGSKRHERPARQSLSEMNAGFDSLVNRAQDIVRGNDPALPQDNWIRPPLTPPAPPRSRDGGSAA